MITDLLTVIFLGPADLSEEYFFSFFINWSIILSIILLSLNGVVGLK